MIAVVTTMFVPGLELAREFYADVVRPLLDDQFPRLRYAAALIGRGSEVAGFDSQRSTDHDWGPRLQLFLTGGDSGQADAINEMLASSLPVSFRGYRVAFPVTREPGGIARHRVEVTGLGSWMTGHLGFGPRHEVGLLDWLATPTQKLAEFTGGEVFHDGPGELTGARQALAWYPRDVWLYLLACQWQRIGQEEAFPGRCDEAGDSLGSVVVTARLARDLMRLCLLMHRRYPPYSKWLGTAVARLPGTAGFTASLTTAITAKDWDAREPHLCQAYEAMAALHNQLGLTPPLDTRVRGCYDRPYQVIGAGRFAAALREASIEHRAMPPAGAADQYIDSTDAIGQLNFLRDCTRLTIQESRVPVRIRRETTSDESAVRAITAAAFVRPGQKGTPEARLVDELRASPAWLPELSLVAVTPEDEIVGHVLCSRGQVDQEPVLALGPLTVRPDSQRRGVGSALMHAVLGAADALGEPLVALLGNPAYYSRFGFRLSSDYQITPATPEWQPHFQVRALTSYRPSLRGTFSYPEPFDRT
jgi:predicted N-acetyltransferase YhbS